MRKQCKRRVYALNANLVSHVIEGARSISQQKLDKIRLLELSQLEALATGKATMADLLGMRDMLNLAETMADSYIGPEAKEACQKAQDAIISIMRRLDRWGKIEAVQGELEALRELFAWHDAQRQAISVAEFERMLNKTMARMRSKHPSVVEIA